MGSRRPAPNSQIHTSLTTAALGETQSVLFTETITEVTEQTVNVSTGLAVDVTHAQEGIMQPLGDSVPEHTPAGTVPPEQLAPELVTGTDVAEEVVGQTEVVGQEHLQRKRRSGASRPASLLLFPSLRPQCL